MTIRGLGVLKALFPSALCIIAFASYAGPQASPGIEDTEAAPYRISVDVHLVALQAVVHDRQGRFVSNLSERDFEVYEDGVLQSIRLFSHEDVPVTVGLVVDHSGSMRTKLPEVIAATRTFVRSSNPEDQMFVVNFNEKVSMGLPAAIRYTGSATELERAIWRAPAAGMTALYDAVVAGLQGIREGKRDRKVLVVISDGGDNASKADLQQVLRLAEQSSAMIYTIGIFDEDDPDRNTKALTRLARATGGEAFFPGQLNEVVQICEGIARDIRNQYALGYVSTNTTRNDSYRAIRVVVRTKEHGKLSVRTRSGYIAAAGRPAPDNHDGAK
jgi:Ca-activated chloride channel family protein